MSIEILKKEHKAAVSELASLKKQHASTQDRADRYASGLEGLGVKGAEIAAQLADVRRGVALGTHSASQLHDALKMQEVHDAKLAEAREMKEAYNSALSDIAAEISKAEHAVGSTKAALSKAVGAAIKDKLLPGTIEAVKRLYIAEALRRGGDRPRPDFFLEDSFSQSCHIVERHENFAKALSEIGREFGVEL